MQHTIHIPISIGEFIDKITILEIKSNKISDPEKLKNVEKELSSLNKLYPETLHNQTDVIRLREDLFKINTSLWEIEDKIRLKEKRKEFDAEFIETARAVYINNDERARLKREINILCQSELTEEKSYSSFIN
jgi:hypothetical protein